MDDLISRQAAIAVAKQHWYKPDIAKALEDLPSAQPEQRWIPVSERLPDPNKAVLISVNGEVDVDWFAFDNTGYGCWYRTIKSVIDIDAWMPLPEPYKGEQE